MCCGRPLLTATAWLFLGAASSGAQEPMTILDQKEWWVAGICLGRDQCGFCAASDIVQKVSLRVEPPKAVSVAIPPDRPAAGVLVEIARQTFTLARGEDGSFQATGTAGREIIRAMRHGPSLTLRVTTDPPIAYRYSLADFPKAYAAILKACPGSAGP
jgi:hypothetical protein